MPKVIYNNLEYHIKFYHSKQPSKYIGNAKPPIETTTCSVYCGLIGSSILEKNVLGKCQVTRHHLDQPNQVIARTNALTGALKSITDSHLRAHLYKCIRTKTSR